MSKTVFMRGLQNFIQDIRACQNKEQEQKRVDKELAKIREKFGDDKHQLDGYDRRKYIWKLLYIYMLGYDIDFGHRQACDLIPKPKYKDKQVGYMACSILLHEGDEFLRLAINGIRSDLISRNEAFECLALSFIGSVGGGEMAETLVPDILKLLCNGATRPLVKKRAALCLLKMIRKTPADQQVVNPDTFVPTLNDLLEEHDPGLLLSVVTLLAGILARNGPGGYEPCQSRLIRLLERLIGVNTLKPPDIGPEYLFYGIPSPWLQAKCLRALQYFAAPEVPADRASLNAMLQVIIDGKNANSDVSKPGINPNKANAIYAIMFEAISLALHLDMDAKLLESSVVALGTFLTIKEANIKYLALESFARLALLPDILVAIRHHQPTVLASMRDPDISIRKKAMDLLFTMCDANNAPDLVGELLAYLVTADFTMREELVLKIAILAEKFAPTVQWYVDTAMHLLERAGDFVNEDIWHRVVQLVTNNESMQQYAARNMVALLRRGGSHESVVCTAAYLLGEYGRLIKEEVLPMDQFRLLNSLFPAASQNAKGLLMTAFIKIYLLAPQDQNLKKEIVSLFERFQKFMDAELQQRAAEYLTLADQPQAAVEKFILPMPKWPERESTLLRQLQKREGTEDDVSSSAVLGTAASGQVPDVQTQTLQPSASQSPPPPAAAASIDLLGDEALLGPSTSDPFAVLQSSASAGMTSNSQVAPAKPPPSNPVDLLSDLFSDTVLSTAPAPVPASVPAPAPVAVSNPFVAAFPSAGPAQVAGSYPTQMTGSYPPQMTGSYPTQMTGSYPSQMTGSYPTQMTGSYPPQMTAGMTPPTYPTAAPSAGPFAVPPPAPIMAPPIPLMAPASVMNPFASSLPISSASAPAPIPLAASAAFSPFGASASGQVSAGPSAGPTGGAPTPYAGPTGGVPSAFLPSYPAPIPAYTLPPAMPPPPVIAAPPTAGGFNDPFGDQAFGAPPVSLPPPVATGDVNAWFNSLLNKERGIFYEDQYLQVGVQARYTEGRGDFTLFLGNKSAEHPLSQVSVVVNSAASVTAAITAPVPVQILPKQQLQVPIQLTCLAPVTDVPSLHLAYVIGNQSLQQQLQIPVANHKFLVPDTTVAKELFFEQWKLYGNPPNKAQEMVSRETPLSTAPIISVVQQAGLGVEHGYLDPSPYNEAGAAYFVFGTPGSKQRALVMCRVEGNPQNMAQFRVTVSSPLPQLSASTKDMIVSKLKSISPS